MLVTWPDSQQKQQVEQLQATLSSAISKESHEKLQQELDAALTNLQLKKDECEKLTMDQTKEKIAQDEEEAKEVQRLNDALKTQNTLIDKLRENLNDNEKGLSTRAITIWFFWLKSHWYMPAE